nr:hypothetical protein [Tanacetum cinerariifolium]
MADNRTIAQLLEAPTEGYEEAIVVLDITANNFEIKHDNVITKKCKCRFEENMDFNQNEGKTGAGRWRGFCVREKVGNEVREYIV